MPNPIQVDESRTIDALINSPYRIDRCGIAALLSGHPCVAHDAGSDCTAIAVWSFPKYGIGRPGTGCLARIRVSRPFESASEVELIP